MLESGKMEWRMWSMLFVLTIIVGAAGCSNSNSGTETYDLQTAVEKALDQVDYRSGSRIQYFDKELPTGSILHPKGPGSNGLAPFTIEKTGYLVFIDEQPDYDWVHAAKLVFFPSDNPEQPVIVFENTPSAQCVAPDGSRIEGQWLKF